MSNQIFFIEPNLSIVLVRCLVAILCGIIIGIERAYRAKPAGVRTHVLISLGSCLFMCVSLFVAEEAKKLGYTTTDPGRIAAQVVTGIGFLGAGTIIRNRGLVKGMTSAATIWCMSAIGLATGAGMLLSSISATIGIILILKLFDFLGKKIRIKRYQLMALEVILKKEDRVSEIRKVLRKKSLTLYKERINHFLGEVHYLANLYLIGNMGDEIEEDLMKIKSVKDVNILSTGDLLEE